MEKDREILEVRATITEEFLVDGEVVGSETEVIDARLEIETVVVSVTSGADHRFTYHPDKLAKVLRAEAIAYFVSNGLIADSPTLALFLGREQLNPDATLSSQGVRPGADILLAPTEKPVDG